jgi:ribosomal protein S18 acetylase RimI-like enzyme
VSGVFPPEWSQDLLESDRRYFEAGAEIVPVPGAVIARLRGDERLAAGCVVQRIDPAGLPDDAGAWLSALEERLRGFACPRARLYLDAPHAALETALARRGYRPREEYGLVRAADRTEVGGTIALRPAADEAGWRERRKLIERSQRAPDGHRAEPDLWVEMERRKHQAGYLRPYLIVSGDAVVGAVGTAPCRRILRLKNLIVDPDHRRRGVATAVASLLARVAAQEGYAAMGCFVLEAEPGVAAYANAGYRRVTQQTEWVRDLGETP